MVALARLQRPPATPGVFSYLKFSCFSLYHQTPSLCLAAGDVTAAQARLKKEVTYAMPACAACELNITDRAL
ncbi:MAG: hypothetical protein KUG77_17940, partial [Nannocystaceae bacterium]|nr:hypothetical protein [Nannocystaceae bacterium]